MGSLAIEITQASGLPERVGTPRDVIANSLGALIGYLLACLVDLVWCIALPGCAARTNGWPASSPSRRRDPADDH